MRHTRWMAILLVLGLILASCGDDDSSSDTATGSGDSTTTTDDDSSYGSKSSATTADESSEYYVEIGTSDTEIGEVLTNPDGLTLYAFTEDEGADQPTCTDACAEKWPPLIAESVDEVELPDGVDVEVALVERASGSMQVTINGSPVYVMGEDEPGKALCQGAGDKWWAVGADGAIIRTLPDTTTTAAA